MDGRLQRMQASFLCSIFSNRKFEILWNESREIPHITCHSLRHTYATILCERGVNLKVMQMLLGHKDISTTMDIYTRVSRDFVFKEYAEKMR